MWISKTIPVYPCTIDMQPKSKSPYLFSTALSCWKGRDHFCLQKAAWFLPSENWNNFKAPNLNSLMEADLWKNIITKTVWSTNPFSAEKEEVGSFSQRNEKKPKKRTFFVFQFLCTCKRGPKVRRTAAQYLESRKNKPFGMWLLTRGSFLMFCFFSNNDSKNWDLGHLNQNRKYPTWQTFDSEIRQPPATHKNM